MQKNVAVQAIVSVEVDRTAEAQWIRQAQARPEAFAPLFEAYYERIFRYLYRLSGRNVLAEDLTSETFEKAMSTIRRYRPGPVPFHCWLYRIAHNAFISHCRKEKVRRLFGLRSKSSEAAVWVENGIRREMDAARAGETVQCLIRRLKTIDQTLILLRYFEGLPIAEAAQATGLTETNARSRLHRALRQLHDWIEAEAPELKIFLEGESAW